MGRKNESWALEDHICCKCGGRILRALHPVVTGGGNPLFRCADCGAAGAAMTTDHLCWCGFSFKGSHSLKGSYQCLPFRVLIDRPHLRNAFLACGSDPDGLAEIGVVTVEALKRYEEMK